MFASKYCRFHSASLPICEAFPVETTILSRLEAGRWKLVADSGYL
jgi:hypothetical protein